VVEAVVLAAVEVVVDGTSSVSRWELQEEAWVSALSRSALLASPG
jgi:hypothetical protein